MWPIYQRNNPDDEVAEVVAVAGAASSVLVSSAWEKYNVVALDCIAPYSSAKNELIAVYVRSGTSIRYFFKKRRASRWYFANVNSLSTISTRLSSSSILKKREWKALNRGSKSQSTWDFASSTMAFPFWAPIKNIPYKFIPRIISESFSMRKLQNFLTHLSFPHLT